jgi:outer membrane protein W
LAVVAAALAAAPATAQDDRWTARARAVAVVTDDDGEPVGGTGSSIAAASSLGVELAVTYTVRPRWALELALGIAPIDLETEGGQAAGLDVGTIDLQSAAVSLTYRFATEGRIDPYLGLGTAYLNSAGWKVTPDMVAAGIGDIAFSTDFRLYAQLGADWELGRHWRLNVDLRYVPMTTEMEFITVTGETLDTAALQINPFLVGIGIAYSF